MSDYEHWLLENAKDMPWTESGGPAIIRDLVDLADRAVDAAAEIARLRTELAEAHERIKQLHPVIRTPTDEERAAMQELADSPHYPFLMQAYCTLADMVRVAEAERDTLRQQLAVSQAELEAERTVTLGQAADIARMAQQLAVAREGLNRIENPGEKEYQLGPRRIARDTLAKLDQMSQSRSEIGPMGEKP